MNVTIIGCGSIGAGWAALFATVGGHRVRAWDPSPGVRATFADKVAVASEHLIELGAQQGADVVICDRIEEALWGADWVQENAPEKLELKAQIYQHIESAVTHDCVVASSTSSYTWSQLADGLKHAQRFVIAHPFNPPHLVPIVELFCPNRGVLDRAVKFFTSLGHVPVCMKKEAAGHIGNRLVAALWREAVHIVAEGIADAQDVDKVLIHGPGLRWSVIGTHLGYHIGGGEGGIEHYLQHTGPSQERRWATLGNPKLTPEVCDAIAAGVRAEVDGRDTVQLERERDRQLIEIAKLRREHPTIDRNRGS
ncbi:MAG: 3-hydroxyacyl-CoA dehydrogenase NAD-binding domain-containing protein [Steroidobacter sp.]